MDVAAVCDLFRTVPFRQSGIPASPAQESYNACTELHNCVRHFYTCSTGTCAPLPAWNPSFHDLSDLGPPFMRRSESLPGSSVACCLSFAERGLETEGF